MTEARSATGLGVRPQVSPGTKLLMGLLLPPAVGIVLQGLAVYGLGQPFEAPLTRAMLYFGIGAAAWSLALRWGRLADAGLRGGRALPLGLTLGMALALTRRRPGAYTPSEGLAKAGAFA